MTKVAYRRHTARSVRKARQQLGFTGEQMAKLVGASDGRIIRRWEAGTNLVPEGASRFLWLLEQLPAASRDRVIDALMDAA